VVAGSQNCSSGVADQKEVLTAWASHLLAVKKIDESINKKGKNVLQLIQCSTKKMEMWKTEKIVCPWRKVYMPFRKCIQGQKIILASDKDHHSEKRKKGCPLLLCLP
jgi:hypothetical protein